MSVHFFNPQTLSFHKTLLDPEIVSHNFLLFISKLLITSLLGVFTHTTLCYALLSAPSLHTPLKKNIEHLLCTLRTVTVSPVPSIGPYTYSLTSKYFARACYVPALKHYKKQNMESVPEILQVWVSCMVKAHSSEHNKFPMSNCWY